MMTRPPHAHGLLIVFEGLDGAGKTTQVSLLAARLRQAGYEVACLREPTNGPWGQKLRHMAQEGRHEAPETELEWFLHDRREDVAQAIAPALAQGQVVLLDRYYFSNMAYQGALGLSIDDIRRRNEAFAPPPDLLLLLDIPVSQGLQRVQQRGALSHFERHDYLTRVAAIFAAMDFPYLQRLDATPMPAQVHEAIWQALAPLLAGTDAETASCR